MNYEPIIGLEVHVELKTRSKMFCRCSADYFGHEPNTHVCPVCLGLPGALPYPNKTAIEWCVKIGLALNCQIPLLSKFDRKNYFYPDLPKGYQISQYDKPFAVNGFVILNGVKDPIRFTKASGDSSPEKFRGIFQGQNDNKKIIRIRRVHMEEDTGKLIHATVNDEQVSLIDFNRSGVPLVEIVTEPDFSSAGEVVEYLKKLQQIVRYLRVSNADMEKGDMRLEPNISLLTRHSETQSRNPLGSLARTRDDIIPSYKVEVKNINSFRFVDRAIEYEIKRQTEILGKGQVPTQETRGWDEKKQITVSQRTKEEAMDYRYFPEPDIPPIRWSEFQIANFKSQMPELPDQKLKRFQEDYNLSTYDSEILTREKDLADYFEEAVKVGKEHNIFPKQIANTIINKKIDTNSVLPAHLIEQIITSSKIATIDNEELKKIVGKVLLDNPNAIRDYKKGKETAIMYLVGQVLRKAGKRIDVTRVRDLILQRI